MPAVLTALRRAAPRLSALRRQLWLRAQAFPEGDPQAMAEWGERLAAVSTGDRLDQELVAAARRVNAGGSLLPHVRARLSAMHRAQGQALLAGVESPETRPPRRTLALTATSADP